MRILLLFIIPFLLLANEKFDYDFFEKNGAVMLLIDPKTGNIVKANETAGKFYGFGVRKLEAMKIQEINTFTKEQVKEERQKALKENRNFFIFRHKLKNGDVKRVEVYSHPIQFNNKMTLFSIIHEIKGGELSRSDVNYFNQNLEEQVDLTTQELLEKEKLINFIIIVVLIAQTIIIAILLQNIKKRKKAEAELNELLATLEERVEKEILKTKEQDKVIYEQRKSIAMNELLINLSHQWRQPLNVMSLQASNILDIVEYEDADIKQIEDAVAQIVKEAKGLSNSITLLQSSYRITEDDVCHVGTVYEQVQSLVVDSFKAVGIEFKNKIDSDFQLRIKESDLLEVFVALFYNVHEIVKKRELTSAFIEVETIENKDEKLLSFKDNAGGFDAELLPDRMFEPYETTQFKSRNKGLGLYVLKSIVTQLGGSVEASNIDSGAKIVIRFKND